MQDLASLQEACQGVEAVVHSAARVHIGWSDLAEQRAVNVEGARNVARAAREAQAKLAHVSTVDALGVGQPGQPADEETPREGKTPCSYVISKREAEEAVLEEVQQGLHAVILNPGFMLGPWDWKPSSGKMLIEVAKRFTPMAPTGGMTLCDVRDVAAGILAALEKGRVGERYILGGHPISYLDAWKLFAQVSGGSAPWFRMGPLIRVAAGGAGDLWGKLSGREPQVNSAAIGMSSLYHYYSSRKAETELGYHCREAEQSVRDAWRWFVENQYV